MKEYIELIQAIPELKPLVQLAFANLKEYKEEFTNLKDFIIEQHVDTKSRIYLGLIQNGVPPEHAVAMAISISNEIKETFDKYSKKK